MDFRKKENFMKEYIIKILKEHEEELARSRACVSDTTVDGVYAKIANKINQLYTNEAQTSSNSKDWVFETKNDFTTNNGVQFDVI